MVKFYLLLTFGTILIFFLGYRMWKLERSISLIAGLFILYYWSIAGGWFLVWDLFTNQSGRHFGLHYYYLFEKLFPVYADSEYFFSLLFYILFIISIQISFLLFRKHGSQIKSTEFNFNVLHSRFILIGLCSIILSLLCILDDVKYAFENDLSVYKTTRHSHNPYFVLHQILNQLAVFSVLFGYTLLIMGKNKNVFYEKNRKTLFYFVYPLTIFLVLSYMLLLGNKHELFFTGIFVLLFYFSFNKKIKWPGFVLLVIIIGIPLVFNDTLRYYSPRELSLQIEEDLEEIKDTSDVSILSFVVFSNEMFSAHMSMYGVLKNEIPPTYGSSIRSLLASFIPKILWQNRPPEIYYYYANNLKLKKGQGYTINHSTAWYLNFSFIGIILGGMVVGAMWAYSYRFQKNMYIKNNKLVVLISLFCTISFSAFMPFLIRNGPESYKALIFEGILIPVLIISACTKRENDIIKGEI